MPSKRSPSRRSKSPTPPRRSRSPNPTSPKRTRSPKRTLTPATAPRTPKTPETRKPSPKSSGSFYARNSPSPARRSPMKITRPSPKQRSPDPDTLRGKARRSGVREHIVVPFYHDGKNLYVDLLGDFVENPFWRPIIDYPWQDSSVTSWALRTKKQYLLLGPYASVPTGKKLIAPPKTPQDRELERNAVSDFLQWVYPPRTPESVDEINATDAHNRMFMNLDILNARGDSFSTALKELALEIFVRANAQDGWHGRFPVYDQGMIVYVRLHAPRTEDEITRLTSIQNIRMLLLAIQYLHPDGWNSSSSGPRAVSTLGVISPEAPVWYTASTNADLPMADAFQFVLSSYSDRTMPYEIAYRVAQRMWKSLFDFGESNTFKAIQAVLSDKDAVLDSRPFYVSRPDHFAVYRRADGRCRTVH